MFVSKHIVGQQNLLSPCKEPTHEVNSVMDIAGQHIEVFFEISKCGFIGPLLNHPRGFDVAQQCLSVPRLDQQFILRGVGLEPDR